MNYMKLIKLMYLVDRRALIETGLPLTGDRMVSMPFGPVLSRVLDNISHGQDPTHASVWFEYLSEPEHYRVALRREAPDDMLSDYHIEALDAVYDAYGNMNEWQLVDFCHTLPEWKNPGGGSIDIDPTELLAQAGRSAEEINLILERSNELAYLRSSGLSAT